MTDSPLPEPSPRNTIAAFVIAAAATLGGAILLLSTRPPPVQITINPPAPTATATTPAPITVYVTGAVNQPEQVITLPYGSRTVDALNATGGITEEADMQRVNLAAVLHDGDQVHVPAKGEIIVLATPGGGVVVHINTATAEEIDTLPGIGPSLAEQIIAYREANGPFRNFDDLDRVGGIGPSLLEQLQGLIAFD